MLGIKLLELGEEVIRKRIKLKRLSREVIEKFRKEQYNEIGELVFNDTKKVALMEKCIMSLAIHNGFGGKDLTFEKFFRVIHYETKPMRVKDEKERIEGKNVEELLDRVIGEYEIIVFEVKLDELEKYKNLLMIDVEKLEDLGVNGNIVLGIDNEILEVTEHGVKLLKILGEIGEGKYILFSKKVEWMFGLYDVVEGALVKIGEWEGEHDVID